MKCPKCNRSICECPEQPEGYELRRFDDLGGEPAPSPTQGERPAEARAAFSADAAISVAKRIVASGTGNVGWQALDLRILADDYLRLSALSSPQEGATDSFAKATEPKAVGADELVAWLRKEGADWQPGEEEWQSPFGNRLIEAAARIEALQRQVAELQDWKRAYEHIAAERSKLLDQAESSLRTLGDALERAREALRLARPFVRDAGNDEDPDAARGAREAEAAIEAALTPTRQGTAGGR